VKVLIIFALLLGVAASVAQLLPEAFIGAGLLTIAAVLRTQAARAVPPGRQTSADFPPTEI
jgi:hypothetical protein